jgi:hypothetical protein
VDGILGFHRAFFHNLFLFSQWNSGYQEALRTNCFPFFSFFFHDGILAIRKPFTRIFSFFTMGFWLSGSLSHEFFFFHDEFWLSGSLSHELFFFQDGIVAIRKPFT